jgi:hypothetical protein
MKVIVKNLLSGKYLATTGAWMDEKSSARCFSNSSEAYLYCAMHAIQHVELEFGAAAAVATNMPFCSAHSSHEYPLDD